MFGEFLFMYLWGLIRSCEVKLGLQFLINKKGTLLRIPFHLLLNFLLFPIFVHLCFRTQFPFLLEF